MSCSCFFLPRDHGHTAYHQHQVNKFCHHSFFSWRSSETKDLYVIYLVEYITKILQSGEDLFTFFFFLFLISIHDVSAAYWIANETQESKWQTKKNSRQNRIATPHICCSSDHLKVRPINSYWPRVAAINLHRISNVQHSREQIFTTIPIEPTIWRSDKPAMTGSESAPGTRQLLLMWVELGHHLESDDDLLWNLPPSSMEGGVFALQLSLPALVDPPIQIENVYSESKKK